MIGIDDSAHEHLYYSPVCAHCRHLDETTRFKCAAFPDGIPFAIWDGENKHTSPVDGDHGIRFEPLAAIAEAEAYPGTEWRTIKGRRVCISGDCPKGTRIEDLPGGHPKGDGETATDPETSATPIVLKPGDEGYVDVAGWGDKEDDAIGDYLYESPKWIPHELAQQNGEISDIELDTLLGYQTEFHNEINNYCRDKAKGALDSDFDMEMEVMPHLDYVIKIGRVEEGHQIFRGVGDTTGARLLAAKVGDFYTDAGYQSWSLSARISRDFSSTVGDANHLYKGVLLRAFTRNDEPARYMNTDEYEILYPRKKKWKIIRKSIVNLDGMMSRPYLMIDVIAEEPKNEG